MKERNSLIDLIKTLSTAECAGLKAYVAHPVAAAAQHVRDAARLLDIILQTAPSFPPEYLKKKALFEAMYPGTPWVNGRLKKVLIALNKQIQAYLLQAYYFREENEFQRQLDLGQIFQKKGLKAPYEIQLQKTARWFAQQQKKDAVYFYQRFAFDYGRSNQELGKNQTRSDLQVREMLENLSIFYNIRRLEILNFFHNQQKLSKDGLENQIPRVLYASNLPEAWMAASADLFVQQKIFDFLELEKPSPNDFHTMRRLLLEVGTELSQAVLSNAYTILRNCCHLFIYSGKTEYLDVLHELHKDNLESGYLYLPENEYKIPSTTFLNLVNVGLLTRQFDWVGQFLETHRDRLLGDNVSGDFFHLNLAIYRFATGQYDAALDILPLTFPNIIYHLMARRLEIKIYYELRSDLLEFKLDAFKMYISRASKKFLSQELRERNADFANLLTQILQSHPGDTQRKERLSKRIRERVRAAERDWLLEKVQRMP